MTQDRSAHYRHFFASQAGIVATTRRQSLVYTAIFAVGLIVLLGGLASPLAVWIYVVLVIGFLFGRGILVLRQSAKIAAESTAHLETISTFIRDDPGRDHIRAKLNDLATPGDNSNVPEALSGMLEGNTSSSETVRAVARSAFGHAFSAVGFAGFMRTALVLAGLFGTVLFFAFELTRPELIAGDLGVLMPGLRGALASTLSGILGSVLVGWFASRVDGLLDGLILETEAFVGGPFLAATARRLTRPEIHSETELWEALRREVASMADRSTQSLDRMSDDVHAHAVSLQAFSDQLSDLPPLRVPPELAKLEDVVAQFQQSAELLKDTVAPLVEAVASLGVFAPAQMLAGMDDLTTSSREWQQSTAGVLGRIEAEGAATKTELLKVTESIEAVPPILQAKLTGIEGAVRGLASSQQAGKIEQSIGNLVSVVNRVETQGASAKADLHEISESIRALPPKMKGELAGIEDGVRALASSQQVGQIERSIGGLAAVVEKIHAEGSSAKADLRKVYDSIEAVRPMLKAKLARADRSAVHGTAANEAVGPIEPPTRAIAVTDQGNQSDELSTPQRQEESTAPDTIMASAKAVSHAANRLEPVATQLEHTNREIAIRTAELAAVAEEIGSTRGALVKALAGLRGLQNWQKKADRAPLMKFLLMPLWPQGRFPFTRHRGGPPEIDDA